MRTEQDYKKLVKGYNVSLSFLKQIKPEIYDKFLDAIYLLNQKDVSFAELVRDLKIDYINENDNKDVQEPKIVYANEGRQQQIFSLLYSPFGNYSLTLIHKSKNKQIFCEIDSVDLDDIKIKKAVVAFRLGTIDKDFKVQKIVNYYIGLADDILVLIRQQIGKTNSGKSMFEIEQDKIEDFLVDHSKEF